MALSRPDIAHKMLARKRAALQSLAGGQAPTPLVTNCPSCLQGLARHELPGAEPVHLAVLLARESGGERWEDALTAALRRAELVNF